jgi:hypothetical protein
MAFSLRNLSVLAYAQGFTLWHYRSGAENLIQVSAPGFFEDASDMFAMGDMVMISAPDGGRIVVMTQFGNQLEAAALA